MTSWPIKLPEVDGVSGADGVSDGVSGADGGVIEARLLDPPHPPALNKANSASSITDITAKNILRFMCTVSLCIKMRDIK